MFRYKIILYAVDEKGNTLLNPVREDSVAFNKHKAIEKSKRALSSTTKIPFNNIRVLNVERRLFSF